jgi:hypothetical protein
MAPQTTPKTQNSERPNDGTCHDCGHGYTPRVPNATKCYPCWRASRTTRAVIDPRAARRAPHRENPDGTSTPVLWSDDRTFALPQNRDGSTPAWRSNTTRAVTLRMRASRTQDPLERRRLRAAAYDLERLGRTQRFDQAKAAQLAPRAVEPAVVVA